MNSFLSLSIRYGKSAVTSIVSHSLGLEMWGHSGKQQWFARPQTISQCLNFNEHQIPGMLWQSTDSSSYTGDSKSVGVRHSPESCIFNNS